MAKKILKSLSVDERDKIGTKVTTPASIVNATQKAIQAARFFFNPW